MEYIILGLGNTGEEYEETRHNAGRRAVEHFRETCEFPEWKEGPRGGYLFSKGAIGKHPVTLVLPELFMNKSGAVIKTLMSGKKKADRLIVAHDDIDLGFGDFKISFGRSSGGHKGVESIVRALKTKDFARVRIGIAPVTPGGKVRKPHGERKVLSFLLGTFEKKEKRVLTRVMNTTDKIFKTIVEHGRAAAMNAFN